MPAGGSGGGSSYGGGYHHHHHHRKHRGPKTHDDLRPSNPLGSCICLSIGTVIGVLITGAVLGVWGSGGVSLVLNLGEERLLRLPENPRGFTIHDDCGGCAAVHAWKEHPDLVAQQWDAPQRWSRSVSVDTSMRTDHYEYWYFSMRNGSRVDVRADLGGRGRLLTMVLDDLDTPVDVATAARNLWKHRGASYIDRNQLFDAIEVPASQQRAIVLVLLANDGYMSMTAHVEFDLHYVHPDRSATSAGRSVSQLWSSRVSSRMNGEWSFVTASAPREQQQRKSDTVTVTVKPIDSDAEAWWQGELRNLLVAAGAVAIGAAFFRYQQAKPAYKAALLEWERSRPAATQPAPQAAQPPVEPLGGAPPTGAPDLPRPL